MGMKFIKAMIRASKFEEVRDALQNLGVEFFTYYDVNAISFSKEQKISYRGRTVMDSGIIPIRVVEIVVPEIDALDVFKAINTAAQTGTVGDGKIFMWDMEKAERIN